MSDHGGHHGPPPTVKKEIDNALKHWFTGRVNHQEYVSNPIQRRHNRTYDALEDYVDKSNISLADLKDEKHAQKATKAMALALISEYERQMKKKSKKPIDMSHYKELVKKWEFGQTSQDLYDLNAVLQTHGGFSMEGLYMTIRENSSDTDRFTRDVYMSAIGNKHHKSVVENELKTLDAVTHHRLREHKDLKDHQDAVADVLDELRGVPKDRMKDRKKKYHSSHRIGEFTSYVGHPELSQLYQEIGAKYLAKGSSGDSAHPH